ncbi:MAG: hypothetical protein ACLPIX_14530 [Rhodomicrobium sp.]
MQKPSTFRSILSPHCGLKIDYFAGCAAAYFPEASELVPLCRHEAKAAPWRTTPYRCV